MARWLSLLLLLALPLGSPGQSLNRESFFEARIRPVLAGTCFKCHGGSKVSAGLRVDSREALVKGGDSGPAVVPGQPEKSLLIQALRHTSRDLKMPPGKKLPGHVLADFETWVRQGAFWPARVPVAAFQEKKHWAFQPIKKPVPPIDPGGWSANPIDRFILAGLRSRGLRPSGPAEPRTLLRRVYFDLIGLPPAPEETSAFLADSSPAAFAKVVERLLASPHYGERWGRYWMDVARYADTAGDNADYPIPEVHRYRDYIIDSFNRDKPYDRFVQEQIAGDLLAKEGPAEEYAARVTATGFLALSRRYATAPYELWHLTLEDTIDTVGRAFLGLSLRCARCHDHKFDPVTMADYYALYGIFASTRFPYAGSEEFASMKMNRQYFVPLLPPERFGPLLKANQEKIHALEERIKRGDKEVSLANQLRELKRRGLPADLPGAYAVSEGKAENVCIQRRGDPEARGPLVKRGEIHFLSGDAPLHIPAGQSGRLQLARSLTAHPLVPRVMVNRIWQHHFGKGIVGTPSNFGTRGEEPTHPELLDYLAGVFVEKGWSIKAMHRLIVLSKTYQMASAENPVQAGLDGANRWYWRFERRRLDAEAIRDALLAVSGTLDRTRPGPHPFPPIAAWGWTQHHPFKDVYPSKHRSVYLMTQRLQRHPFLALFDGPDTNTTTGKRSSSTVPLQALFWMNSPMMRDLAAAFARRLQAEAADTPARIRRAFELAYARPPRPEELERGRDYLDRYREELRRAGTPPAQVEGEAWVSYARVLLGANEFIFID